MSALTKAEMAELLADKMELSRREAKDLVEVFFEQITQALISGREVKLSGFGNFELKDKSARPGRNPKTGEKRVGGSGGTPRRVKRLILALAEW